MWILLIPTNQNMIIIYNPIDVNTYLVPYDAYNLHVFDQVLDFQKKKTNKSDRHETNGYIVCLDPNKVGSNSNIKNKDSNIKKGCNHM